MRVQKPIDRKSKTEGQFNANQVLNGSLTRFSEVGQVG